jgi:PIN domain nuclease of toxin-antitoxin system
MRLLLDTQAFLWFALNEPPLSSTARALMTDPANDILISPASYWEIAIKIRLGRYTLNVPL